MLPAPCLLCHSFAPPIRYAFELLTNALWKRDYDHFGIDEHSESFLVGEFQVLVTSMLSVNIGIFLAYLLGMFVHWRLLAVIGILPCTILIPSLFFIPESPRWLAKMGMMEDFEASLQVLRGFDTDITAEVKCYAKEKIMTIPRKEKKRKTRREEKAKKAAVLDMVFRRCTGF
ncbi:hypothetical protein ZIOFF_001512 [Zingiber officinale]|uniref:Uncharacterized protein n=1 Tax=Zingiber officinale TaxID=94328 RepID=A0A8J5HUY6_ZINOF|nr:hypothetical protein ZIOFF_001512 [Zingiber officinale]